LLEAPPRAAPLRQHLEPVLPPVPALVAVPVALALAARVVPAVPVALAARVAFALREPQTAKRQGCQTPGHRENTP